MVLTGDPITAERAHELGLVNRLSEPGAALETAITLAPAMSANGPLALKASKRILRESAGWRDSEFFTLQEAISGPVLSSQDAAEGARAFAEKRAPIWRGV